MITIGGIGKTDSPAHVPPHIKSLTLVTPSISCTIEIPPSGHGQPIRQGDNHYGAVVYAHRPTGPETHRLSRMAGSGLGSQESRHSAATRGNSALRQQSRRSRLLKTLPVHPKKFAARNCKYPAPLSGNSAAQPQISAPFRDEIEAETDADRKIPCRFPVHQGISTRDWWLHDCPHLHFPTSPADAKSLRSPLAQFGSQAVQPRRDHD